MDINETPQTPQMRELRSILATLGERTDLLGDYAAQAYYTVSDVGPPYPGVPAATGAVSLDAAVTALKAAVQAATGSPELDRLAEAVDLLREARQV